MWFIYITWAISVILTILVIRSVVTIHKNDKVRNRRIRHHREQKAYNYLWPYLREADKDC